jgi:tetratricopeptide (TPR) repeat protein
MATRIGREEEATALYQSATSAYPLHPEARALFARSLFSQNRIAESVSEFNEVSLLASGAQAPAATEAWAAAIDAQSALALEANNAAAQALREGNFAAAKRNYERAIAIYPKGYHVISNLVYLLSTCPDKEVRDGDKAVALSKQLFDIVGSNPSPEHFANAAAAHAEVGDFVQATEFIQKAIEAAEKNERQRAQLEIVAQAYAEKRPWRHQLTPAGN